MLGHWDAAGGQYTGGKGVLVLITKDGKHIARGMKIQNNLYEMKSTVRKPNATLSKQTTSSPQMFTSTEPAQS